MPRETPPTGAVPLPWCPAPGAAQVVPPDDDRVHPLLAGPGRRLGRMGRRQPMELQMELKNDGLSDGTGAVAGSVGGALAAGY